MSADHVSALVKASAPLWIDSLLCRREFSVVGDPVEFVDITFATNDDDDDTPFTTGAIGAVLIYTVALN